MAVSICVFAHNEERFLRDCIDAVERAADGLEYSVSIVENGSMDRTPEIARSLEHADPRVRAHSMPFGDKAEAWNRYVHELAPEAKTHVFLDGDIRPAGGSVRALHAALGDRPDAYGAAAMPGSGRSRDAWRARLVENHYLSGNLYALSAGAVAAFRRRGLRFPFGAMGEDGLLSYILLTDFRGGDLPPQRERIVPVTDAEFEFDSLMLKPADLAIYHRRLKRYSERHFEKAILYPILRERGLAAMPATTAELYTTAALEPCRPRRHPIDFFYDWVTLRRLRRVAIGGTQTRDPATASLQ